jgi:hypothetical protein
VAAHAACSLGPTRPPEAVGLQASLPQLLLLFACAAAAQAMPSLAQRLAEAAQHWPHSPCPPYRPAFRHVSTAGHPRYCAPHDAASSKASNACQAGGRTLGASPGCSLCCQACSGTPSLIHLLPFTEMPCLKVLLFWLRCSHVL